MSDARSDVLDVAGDLNEWELHLLATAARQARQKYVANLRRMRRRPGQTAESFDAARERKLLRIKEFDRIIEKTGPWLQATQGGQPCG